MYGEGADLPHLTPFVSVGIALDVLFPFLLRRAERPVAGIVLTDAVFTVAMSTCQLGRPLHLVGGAAVGVSLLLLFGTAAAAAASFGRLWCCWAGLNWWVGGRLLVEVNGLKTGTDPFSAALQKVVDLIWSGVKAVRG